MLDFMMVTMRSPKRGTVEIYPKFIIGSSKDLMIRGGDFYAIWNEELGLWSTSEDDAQRLIDKELREYYEQHASEFETRGETVHVQYMWDADTGTIDKFHRYCQKQMRDHFHSLDEKIIFSDTVTKRSDYASKKLEYSLVPQETPNYTELSTTLYSEEELHKLEWAIGAIITGDAKKIQKFEVLYGSAGSGKGTMLEIIAKLFDGYCCAFEAKALGNSNAAFALEPFKNNPLVAIDFDGNLSRIEDNTRLNALVSHEEMPVNTKYGKMYSDRFKCFIFMGTNNPVKITDAKSGLMRRLVDVYPSGNKIPLKEYKKLVHNVQFELGGIACHCRDVYLADPDCYEGYIPINMMGESNDFYNFIEDSADIFSKQEYVTLKQAWTLYKEYIEEARLSYPLNMRAFKSELKNYFNEFHERLQLDNGERPYNCYVGFKLNFDKPQVKTKKDDESWLKFGEYDSVFDILAKDYPAQYATSEGIPSKKWQNNTTLLGELKTSKLHYVKVPSDHIVIDFDIPDEHGNKCLARNLEAAAKWPPTYAELSKSGQGIHLHYIYTGDPTKLSNIYDDHIEIKVFNGNSSLRRQLSKCNNLPIAKISSGLPQKGDKVTNFDGLTNEKSIRTLIKRNLAKDIHPGTKPSIDFIKKILDDAYESGVKYDVSDMINAVLGFAAGSTNHSEECIKLVNQMHFKSKEILDDDIIDEEPIEPDDPTPIFYDVEVFPNLFLINWMRLDKELFDDIIEKIKEAKNTKQVYKIIREGLKRNKEPVVRMINPKPSEVEELMKHRLVGFNCRRYDNHMLWARMMGYSEEQLFRLSQRIIVNQDKDAFFGEAYNVSYTDIYDYASKKQSLKKWEIEIGIKHLELNLPWDQPVPKEKWLEVAEYCDNDVLSTFAVYIATHADFVAREILADIAGGTVNDTTNTLTGKLIFGSNKKPQSEFNYRFLGEKPKGHCFTWKDVMPYATGESNSKPEGKVWFDGYEFKDGVSTYRGYEVGEGGRVYANPGMYGYSKTFDVASMHPHSVIAEKLFGDEYTDIFKELVDTRVFIKHKNFEAASKLFGGKLAKYLDDPTIAKNLAQALKIAINSVYGLTSAKFPNVFRDPRNVDNIVAKRGALFMIDLQLAVESLGYTVIHEKTDSIKIHEPDEFIENFVLRFGECYGYSFEVEDVWDRICLVNDAVFVGHTDEGWKATGTEFQVPYVFKTLFTGEPIEFDDLCETKSVSKGALYLDFEDGGSMRFVGRVGQFCPVKHGGVLYRVDNGKNYAAAGTKGYQWLESSMVTELGKEDDIDMSYYENMARDAMFDIFVYGDFNTFVNTDKKFVKEDAPVSKEAEVPLELPFK